MFLPNESSTQPNLHMTLWLNLIEIILDLSQSFILITSNVSNTYNHFYRNSN